MKSSEIEVGTEYEVSWGGTLKQAEVVAVGRKTRRVHSGERWDTRGHESTGTVVTIRWPGGEQTHDVTPQQVKRPWAEAASEYEERAARKARARNAAHALTLLGIRAYEPWGVQAHISISLSVEEAEELARRLS